MEKIFGQAGRGDEGCLVVWLAGRLAEAVAVVALAVLVLSGGEAQARPVVVFDMAFINFSQEVDLGISDAPEQERIRMLSAYLRDLLAETKTYDVIDGSQAGASVDNRGGVFACNHCEEKLARKLGGETSITGAVRKISVLVQTIVLRERDAESGEVLWQYQTDIRNNSDEAWRRGLKWLMDHRVMVGKDG